MTSFQDLCFTPVEFSRLTGLDRHAIQALETEGRLQIIKKRIGNVDRKFIPLEGVRQYFQTQRSLGGRHGDRNTTPDKPLYRIQMFYNVKGGTGKSTLTAQFAMHAALIGLNVLAIDLDGQGHLTVNLDVLDAHERPSIYDVLINDLPLKDAIMNVAPGLDLVPANLGLCNIEIPLNNKTRREYRLSEAIAKVAHQYDLIVADTNPAASILNGSMLVASNQVSVVCATNPLSFHGMNLVMATIEGMEREFSKELEVKIIPNMYDNREVISQEVLGELRRQFEDFCTESVINRCVDFNEATKQRTTIWAVNAKGIAAGDMKALANELLYDITETKTKAAAEAVAAATEKSPSQSLPEASL